MGRAGVRDPMRGGARQAAAPLQGRTLALLLVALTWMGDFFAESQEQVQAAVDINDGDDLGQDATKAGKIPMLKMDLSVGTGTGYVSIPNFVVSHRSHRVEVKSRVGCENVCDQHRNCHSFSYRAGDKRCMWSEEALRYDSKFSFFMKITKMNDVGQMKPTGKYKRFGSLVYKEKGWRKLTAAQADCQDLCDKMNKCSSYSYREFDNLCLMSDDGVKYDTDFTYYEREHPPRAKTSRTKIRVLAQQSPKKRINGTKELLKQKAQSAAKAIKKVAKTLPKERETTKLNTNEQEAKLHVSMQAAVKERKAKGAIRIKTDKYWSQERSVKNTFKRNQKEAKEKAGVRIRSAFQEGYMKAQEKNHGAYERQVKEINAKQKESQQKHLEHRNKEVRHKRLVHKEKVKKERLNKELTKKQAIVERKAKAKAKAAAAAIAKKANTWMHRDDIKKNAKEIKAKKFAIRESRQKREKKYKKAKIQEMGHKEELRQKYKVHLANERKRKVQHEARVKDVKESDIKYAHRKKELAFKEIRKKQDIFQRRKAAAELKRKLEAAKRHAELVKKKHKEMQTKIGMCKERRAKGRFEVYSYARETVFVDGANAATKFGADKRYDGMLRVQNGLGNKKQHAYLRFSAKGNKIIGSTAFLGEGDQMAEGWGNPFARRRRTKAKRGIKLPIRWSARRRYIDRRRRWTAQVVRHDRRRSAVASRRRVLTQRRRRTIARAVSTSSVTKAQLAIYKFGGPAAKVVAKAVSCKFKRKTLDWPSSTKLSLPESLRRLLSQSIDAIQMNASTQLTAAGGEHVAFLSNMWGRRRRAPRPPPPPIIKPLPKPYIPSRRRYVDRRRRFKVPVTARQKVKGRAPPPSTRRRRIQGKTLGASYVPAGKNKWITIKLSPNLVGLMRSLDKMCIEISGGAANEPTVFGSELSTQKPHLVMNVKDKGGARRRRCSSVVALKALSKHTRTPAIPKKKVIVRL